MSSADQPPFPDAARYHRLNRYIKERFGRRVFKVTLRGGFSCPNRDGRIGRGGCTFCSEQSLIPLAGPAHGPLSEQLRAGLGHLKRRHRAEAAIAYFQEGASTDAPPDELEQMYTQALDDPRVVALSVGTRPDCLPDGILDLMGRLARRKPVWLELGLQSASDDSLRILRRRHTVGDFRQAVIRAQEHGLDVIAHVILDLPWEQRAERDATAALLCDLGVAGVKIHNLHVLRGTTLAEQWRAGRISLSSREAYIDQLIDFLERIDEGIVIHRLTGEAPASLMLAPRWGLDKRGALKAIELRLEERETWQGRRLLT
jgi:uncharacterized protein